jgi:ATP-grasp domain, R2K clade family 3
MSQPLDHWLIQSTGIRRSEDAEAKIIRDLAAIDIPFVDFGVIPFTNEITGWQNFRPTPGFIHCSTKVLRILTDDTIDPTTIFVGADAARAKKLLWTMRAGLFYDRHKFDQDSYRRSRLLVSKQALLNHDARIMRMGDILHEEMLQDTFMKPTQDLKLFKGGIVEGGWSLFRHVTSQIADEQFFMKEAEDMMVVVAPPKAISHEWRFFIVDHQVIAHTQYMKHGQIVYNAHVPDFVQEAAECMCTYYKPDMAYTMDLCLTSDAEIKIVEYNCINCSGLYLADITALAHRLSSRYDLGDYD